MYLKGTVDVEVYEVRKEGGVVITMLLSIQTA